MRKIPSTQRGVQFVWCKSPITIDKRGSWGPSADNLQRGPNGAFLKMSSPSVVSHLVQPNADKSSPIGWVKGDADGLYNKADIWITEEVIAANALTKVLTADGPLEYQFADPSMIVYNDKNGAPDLNDAWVVTMPDLKKYYVL